MTNDRHLLGDVALAILLALPAAALARPQPAPVDSQPGVAALHHGHASIQAAQVANRRG